MTHSNYIHPTAIVSPKAKLGKRVVVEAYSIIDDKVTIGDDTIIKHHAYITGKTTLGCGNFIAPFATIGTSPFDKKYKQEETELIIGDNNQFREYSLICTGTIQDLGKTIIGSRNLFMSNTHVAHDCVVGDDIVFSVGATLGGHVKVDSYAIIGGLTAVHQKVRIGSYSMIGGACAIMNDIPPYALIDRPSKLLGANIIGLKRRGFEPELIKKINQYLKFLFVEDNSLTLQDKMLSLDWQGLELGILKSFLEFTSTRGLMSGKKD